MNYIMGWFEKTQYDDKKLITIAKFVETMWLSRYSWITKTTYDCRSEFLLHN